MSMDISLRFTSINRGFMFSTAFVRTRDTIFPRAAWKTGGPVSLPLSRLEFQVDRWQMPDWPLGIDKNLSKPAFSTGSRCDCCAG